MSDSFSHFDNEFEKLSSGEDDGLVTSSGVDEVKSGDVGVGEYDQLIDFGEPIKPQPSEPIQPQPAVPTEPIKPAQPEPTAVPKSPVLPSPEPAVECCSWTNNVDSRVLDLLYWHDIKKTGALFATTLSLLLSLALFSIISVVAYMSMIALTITISFRAYKAAMGAVQKSGDEHPFRRFLETDIKLSDEKIHDLVEACLKSAVSAVNRLRRLFLLEDVIETLKFALLLWILSYIGSWFNGMTLVILADVGLFTLPKVYDTNRVLINQYLDIVHSKMNELQTLVQEKVPFLAKAKQA